MIFIVLGLGEDQLFAWLQSHLSAMRRKLNQVVSHCLGSVAIIMEAWTGLRQLSVTVAVRLLLGQFF